MFFSLFFLRPSIFFLKER